MPTTPGPPNREADRRPEPGQRPTKIPRTYRARVRRTATPDRRQPEDRTKGAQERDAAGSDRGEVDGGRHGRTT